MNGAGEDEGLPQTIGGLIDLGFVAWTQHAPLYLALSAVSFAVCGALEALWPAPTRSALVIKDVVISLIELLTLALVVAAVALGVAARVAGERMTPRALLAAALQRWLAVFGAMIVVWLVVNLTAPLGALGPLTEPRALTLFAAPVIWLVWGILSLAGPIAALSGERPLIAWLTSFGRAVALSVRRGNFARICVVGFATIVPTLIASILDDVLTKRAVPHAVFWANLPIDVLSVGLVTALQTAFAVDFARRAGSFERPPPT